MYSPPSECAACRLTKMRFERLGISYEVAEADSETVSALKNEGFTSFPVVKVDCGDGSTWSWSGYRHDDISKLAQLFMAG